MINEERPTKTDYYMGIAKAVSVRAGCLKRKYGCVLVKDDVIISTGYNGPPRGIPHCTKCHRAGVPSGVGYSECPAVHAEENAIINAARAGHSTFGAELFLWGDYGPCDRCMAALINAGISIIHTRGCEPMMPHISRKGISNGSLRGTVFYTEE